MTNSEQAIREKAINIFADIFTAGGEAHEVGGQSFDQLQQSGYIDRKITDLTALIREHYVAKEEVDKMVSERDDDIFDKMNCLIGYLERWLNNPQSNNPPAELRSVIDEAIEYLKTRDNHE